MTNDSNQNPDLSEIIKSFLEQLSASTPPTPRNTNSVSGRLLEIVNSIAATIAASEVKVPDDISEVFDNPRAKPKASTTPAPPADEQPAAAPKLPTLRTGVYKHWRNGDLYNVLGYARDASNMMPKDYTLVVYTPLNAKPGPTMFVRIVDEFLGRVCTTTNLSERACDTKIKHQPDVMRDHHHTLVDRFTYQGPEIS